MWGPGPAACVCVPGDGQQGQAAAAAAGEGVWGQLRPRQDLQHAGLPPEEVCDQTHELQQRDGVVPDRWETEGGSWLSSYSIGNFHIHFMEYFNVI